MAATWTSHDCHGFDFCSGVDVAKYHTSGGSGTIVTQANTRNNFGQAITAGADAFLRDAFANSKTVRQAGAVKPTSGSDVVLYQTLDNGTVQNTVVRKVDGTVAVHTGDQFTTAVATSSSVMPLNTWKWISVLYYIDNGAGTGRIIVDVGGVNVIDFTGDTQVTANAFATQTLANLSGVIHDDYHWSWGSGSPILADQLADSSVIAQFAITPGDNQDFSLSAGSSHVAMMRDSVSGGTTGVGAADGDITYGYSPTNGHREGFLKDPLPAGIATVNFIVAVAMVRKTDAAARTAKLFTRRNGTTNVTVDGTAFSVTDTYRFQKLTVVQDPHPAAPTAWTPTTNDATQVGVKVES